MAEVASKEAKIEKHENCELEAGANIRPFDIRTNGGRLPFLRQVISSKCSICPNAPSACLSQVLPGVPEPSVYWAEDDPRARAGHQGIVVVVPMSTRNLKIYFMSLAWLL